MVLDFRLGAVAVGSLLTIFFLRTIVNYKRYPSAPGPRLAAWTHWWLVWKYWEGNFETWNFKEHAKKGKVVRVATNTYSIDDPEAVKLIYTFSSPLKKTKWYDAFADPSVSNHNLFAARDIKVHAQMRRLAANMYSMTAIKSYEPYVDNCTSVLRRQFDKFAAQNSAINLQYWMHCYAFDVVGELTYGHRIGFLDSGRKDTKEIMDNLEKAGRFSTLLGLDFRLLPFLFAMYGNPIAGNLAWVASFSKLDEAAAEKPKSSNKVAETFSAKLGKIREKDPESFEKYRGENVKTANLLAGSETTSASLTAIMFYLLKNDDALRKLRAEVSEGIAKGEVDDPITFDQAQNLPYLQACIKEAMRLYPATGFPMWREVPKGGLTVSETFFPEGSIVGINSWVAHHNADVFGPDPDAFRPERWMPEETSDEDLASMEKYYIPFGGGTRTCLGKNIAMLEISKLIPELIRSYEFELVTPEMKFINSWIVKQKDLYIRVKRAK